MLTQEQRRKRLGKITSSVAAAALGLDERVTPLQAWCAVTGQDDDSPLNLKAIDRGNRLESPLLDYPCNPDKASQEATGIKPGDLDRFEAPFKAHPKHAWAGDSADATYHGDGYFHVGEAKTCNLSVAKLYGDEGTDEVPNHTLIQAHWHLIHWPEAKSCLVPVLVGGYTFEFRLYEVKRNPDLEGTLLDDLAKWHRDHVVTMRPPQVEAGDSEWVKRRLTEVHEGKWLEAGPVVDKLVADAHHASENLRAAKEAADCAKNRLRMALGDCEGINATWGKVYFRASKSRAVTNWEAVALALGADEPRFERTVMEHTRIVPGPRSLRLYIKGFGND